MNPVAQSKLWLRQGLGPLAGLRHEMPRDEFFAVLAALACINGLLGRALQAVDETGWFDSLIGAFGISAIVWAACFIGMSELLHDKTAGIRSADLSVGAGLVLLVSLPIWQSSWMALTGLCLYILVFADGPASRRRGAVILLATTVPMLWSRMSFNFFANFILAADASLVSSLLGTGRVGNMVRFADDSGYLVVFPACSSLANMSLAFLCWLTMSMWLRQRWSPRDLLWGLLVCFAVMTANVARMSLMGLSQDSYELVHGAWGEAFAGAIMLALTVGISLWGVRRELVCRV